MISVMGNLMLLGNRCGAETVVAMMKFQNLLFVQHPRPDIEGAVLDVVGEVPHFHLTRRTLNCGPVEVNQSRMHHHNLNNNSILLPQFYTFCKFYEIMLTK